MVKTTQQARDYFKNAGLSYADMTPQMFFDLVEIVKEELPNNDYCLEMHVHQKTKKNNTTYNYDSKGFLKNAFIKVDGPYFKAREAISFNQNGFIGFAGWASGVNTEPFIDAFVKWCNKNAKSKVPHKGDGITQIAKKGRSRKRKALKAACRKSEV
jgi:hypothetical protein